MAALVQIVIPKQSLSDVQARIPPTVRGQFLTRTLFTFSNFNHRAFAREFPLNRVHFLARLFGLAEHEIVIAASLRLDDRDLLIA